MCVSVVINTATVDSSIFVIVPHNIPTNTHTLCVGCYVLQAVELGLAGYYYRRIQQAVVLRGQGRVTPTCQDQH